MQYNGITRDSLFLLAENRFRNSRDFYEEHKEQIKQGVIVPMRQIAGILGEELIALDPLMNTIPTKMVSRVRRDTRYTKDKSLYREHCWIMFMRPKDSWRGYPCMWLEISPDGYDMGIAFFGECAGLMETFRKLIREKPDEFKKAASKALKSGSVYESRQYKRGFDGAPAGLEEYYNSKDFCFIKKSADLSDLESEKIIQILKDTFRNYAPMYQFSLEVSDEYFSKEG